MKKALTSTALPRGGNLRAHDVVANIQRQFVDPGGFNGQLLPEYTSRPAFRVSDHSIDPNTGNPPVRKSKIDVDDMVYVDKNGNLQKAGLAGAAAAGRNVGGRIASTIMDNSGGQMVSEVANAPSNAGQKVAQGGDVAAQKVSDAVSRQQQNPASTAPKPPQNNAPKPPPSPQAPPAPAAPGANTQKTMMGAGVGADALAMATGGNGSQQEERKTFFDRMMGKGGGVYVARKGQGAEMDESKMTPRQRREAKLPPKKEGGFGMIGPDGQFTKGEFKIEDAECDNIKIRHEAEDTEKRFGNWGAPAKSVGETLKSIARIFKAVPEKYSHINFKPPASVANAARRGLDMRKKASPSNKGGLTQSQASQEGIGSGVARATSLANRQNQSPQVISQMVSFFARHGAYKHKHSSDPGGKAQQSWLQWGGDAGKSWAEKVKRQMDAADKKDVKKSVVAVDDVLVKGWAGVMYDEAIERWDSPTRDCSMYRGSPFYAKILENKAATLREEAKLMECGPVIMMGDYDRNEEDAKKAEACRRNLRKLRSERMQIEADYVAWCAGKVRSSDKMQKSLAMDALIQSTFLDEDLYKASHEPPADYWRTISGNKIPFTGTPGSGTPHAVPDALKDEIKPGGGGGKDNNSPGSFDANTSFDKVSDTISSLSEEIADKANAGSGPHTYLKEKYSKAGSDLEGKIKSAFEEAGVDLFESDESKVPEKAKQLMADYANEMHNTMQSIKDTGNIPHPGKFTGGDDQEAQAEHLAGLVQFYSGDASKFSEPGNPYAAGLQSLSSEKPNLADASPDEQLQAIESKLKQVRDSTSKSLDGTAADIWDRFMKAEGGGDVYYRTIRGRKVEMRGTPGSGVSTSPMPDWLSDKIWGGKKDGGGKGGSKKKESGGDMTLEKQGKYTYHAKVGGEHVGTVRARTKGSKTGLGAHHAVVVDGKTHEFPSKAAGREQALNFLKQAHADGKTIKKSFDAEDHGVGIIVVR